MASTATCGGDVVFTFWNNGAIKKNNLIIQALQMREQVYKMYKFAKLTHYSPVLLFHASENTSENH